MSKLIKAKRGQFVIIAALLIAALTLATTISIHEINSDRQEITYRPGNEFLLGTTSDLNRALTVALANYTEGILNQGSTEEAAKFTASIFMDTWKQSLLTSYSSYGIRINFDLPQNLIPWFQHDWNGSRSLSYAYIPYSFDVDSYGFNGWMGETRKYVQLQIFSETVKTNWETNTTSLIFQLTQSEVNENYSMPITDLPSNPDITTFRIGAYNLTPASFNAISPLTLTYLGGGNYNVTFNQALDPIHNGVRLDLSTPKDEIWISAFNYNYGTASPIMSTLLLNPTGDTLPSPATVALGESVTASVNVTGLGVGYPVPSGTVAFQVSTDGVSNWITFDDKALNGSGSATSDPYNASATGPYYFQTLYSGDHNYSPATYGQTAEEPLIVNRATPTMDTWLSQETVTLGQSVTASVNVTGLVGSPPSGSVRFEVRLGGSGSWTEFNNRTLVSGFASSCSFAPSSAGTWYFRAVYSGDDDYIGSQSGDAEEPLTVNTAIPIVSTLLSPANVTLGGFVRDSVTVSGLGGGYPVPSGTVDFQVSTDNGYSWAPFGASKTLDGSGIALSDSYNASSTVTYYFRAIYSGDSNYQDTQSGYFEEPLIVNRAAPSVSTLLSAITIGLDGSITDSVNVTGFGGSPVPTGSVRFEYRIGTSGPWNTFGASKTLSGGSAISDSYTPFSAGTWYFRAVYSGDSNYASAASGNAEEPLIVNRATPTMDTWLSQETVTLGQSVTDSVTITGLGGGYPVPSGTVAFQVSTDNGSSWATFGSKTLDGSGSAASDLYTPFSAGTWYFKVAYSGDSYYENSESDPTDPLTVNTASPTVVNSLFPAAIIIGQNITESATVSGVVGGLTPTGNVTFQFSADGVSNWITFGANKTLQGGFATSDLYKPLSAGTWYFKANYSGDSNYASAASGTVTLTVSMTPGQVGTYYVVSDSPSGQDPYLSNSTNLPPLDKVNPDLSNGHPSLNVTTKVTSPVPSIMMSNTIRITYALQVKSTQTIQTEIGFIYNNIYYQIGSADFEAIGATGNPPPAYYTVSIPVDIKTFVAGFPMQAIPTGSQIVLRTTLLDPKERVNLLGGMGGTRIVFY